jgi:hypothetical protein
MKNSEMCGFSDQVHLARGDVSAVLRQPERYSVCGPFDLVTITPPYEEVVYKVNDKSMIWLYVLIYIYRIYCKPS